VQWIYFLEWGEVYLLGHGASVETCQSPAAMTVTQRTRSVKEMSEALWRYVQQSTGESPRSIRNAATICAALTRVVLVQLGHGHPNVDSEELQLDRIR
jgi:hypothetical protein